jgi:hypothetical protein
MLNSAHDPQLAEKAKRDSNDDREDDIPFDLWDEHGC